MRKKATDFDALVDLPWLLNANLAGSSVGISGSCQDVE